MTIDRETAERLLRLELGLKEAQDEIAILDKKVKTYDAMAMKWGGILMGATGVAALVGGNLSTVKGKIMEFLQ